MKNKNKQKNYKKPFHLHIEHFLTGKICLIAMLGLFTLAILKSDSKLLGVIREAYAQGFGVVGAYMREETVRTPVSVTTMRLPTTSGN